MGKLVVFQSYLGNFHTVYLVIYQGTVFKSYRENVFQFLLKGRYLNSMSDANS